MQKKNCVVSRLCLPVALWLLSIPAFSQDSVPTDTSYLHSSKKIFEPVEIRPLDQFGLNSEKPDSIFKSHYASGTLTDLLGQNGLSYLKTYGGGSLATTSVRGASASQTPVMWNGFNLQSPTNGNVDLSLLPVILFDDVSLQNGANSSQYGSGAIGGVVNTNSSLLFTGNKKWEAKYVGSAGSFGEMNHGLKIGFSNSRLTTDIRAYHQQAKNDFTFRNFTLPGNPLDTLENGDFLQEGIQLQAKVALNEKNYITGRSWFQSSDRGIAPSMFETNGHARQTDQFSRSMLQWDHVRNHFKLIVKSAAMTEFMNYDPGFSQPISTTRALSLINDATVEYRPHHYDMTISAGISDTWSQADVTQYMPSTQQNRASVFAGIRYQPYEKILLSLNFREEELNGKAVPLVGSFGFDGHAFKWLTLKMSISRNYRIPTFNDLYWNPGGNPDLKSEDSWNEEVTTNFHFRYKKFFFSYIVTGFNRNTTNWIQWTPGASYWSPRNLLSVWSRGVEHRVKATYAFAKWNFTLIGGYDYVRATNEKSAIPNDPSLGLQLMYLPADRWNAMVQIDYRKFYLAYLHQFTDIRFTSTDHSSFLPAFSTAQVTLGKRIDYKDSYGDLFFRVDNLFDLDYQAVPFRPMPGRYFQLGLTIDFNKQTE